MKTELFRLTEDEGAILQLYRALSDDGKAAITIMLGGIVESEETPQNVIQLFSQKRA